MVDVDARGGWDNLSHRLTHQIVVIIIHWPRLVNHSFVDAVKSILTITHALVDNLAILDHMAQPPPILILVRGIGLTGKRRQQVSHVATVKADALHHIGQRVTLSNK